MIDANKFKIGLYPVPGIPEIQAQDDIARIIFEAVNDDGFMLRGRDIIVITHKIISRAENSQVNLESIEPSGRARELAEKTGRDPRFCQVIINESAEIIGTSGRHIITRHRLGHICTEAGIDSSNTDSQKGQTVCLLPKDPDMSARIIRNRLKQYTGKEIAVIICDTFGNEFRNHSISLAIGIAGINPKTDCDATDLFGKKKRTTAPQVDEIAAAAGMLMGQGDEGAPIVLARGIKYTVSESSEIKEILK